MCQLCRSYPCRSTCPNADEEKPVIECVDCGKDLYEGDDFIDGVDGPVCKSCVEDMDSYELLELLGIEYEKVKKEETEWKAS